MQRPRRTSEFQDDPGGIRRQSRVQLSLLSTPAGSGIAASCTGGTAKKYSTRQSRIAIPSRASSSDRGGANNPYLTVPSSSKQRGVTPEKTPLPKTTASRVLFTVEKQRNGPAGTSSSVPLHNDKKWVQEQTHRITEHLLSQNTLGGGISTDFLSRGLRQMSIKQFVGIINYFLGFIWGNRYTVGNNHVEDIINILQKLQYPHPLNKSWLKTPNTQHSFGNVIVLFDFLMDFVPPEGKNDDLNQTCFNLKEPAELSCSKMNEDHFQIPDLEFQQELLSNSEKGFLLWDKQKKEEFDSLKIHTCNLLINKMSGVADIHAIELEIQKLQEILRNLENERPPEDKEMSNMKSKLSHELKCIRHEIKTNQEEFDTDQIQNKNLTMLKMATVKEIDTIKVEIKSLEEVLNNQYCSIEQRNQMIADVMQHKQMLAIKERAIQDLQNRYHNEQILQSKTLKQFNDQIEKFNAHMREVKFSHIVEFDKNSSLNETNLELSLRPKNTELDKLIPLLEHIHEKALYSKRNIKENIFKIQDHCERLTNDIDTILHPKLNALRAANATNAGNLNTIEQNECKILKNIQKLKEDIIEADKTIKEYHSDIKHKKCLVGELMQANEQTMQHAEEKQRQCLEKRKAFLEEYDKTMEECIQNDVLQQLTKQIQLQEKRLEDLKKDFN